MAQGGYDSSWYNPNAPHIKIAVVEDGVYRITGSNLATALPSGTSLGDITASTVRLLENGQEIPIHYSDLDGDDTLDPNDTLTFVGRRNRGTDEMWAYDGDASAQSSTYYSLFSDTTFYWLTWDGDAGMRYNTVDPPTGTSMSTTRDTLHLEQDNTYFYGDESGDPRYTLGEGYYWERYNINSEGTNIEKTHTTSLDRLAGSSGDDVTLRVRFMGTSGSTHRVRLDVEPAGGGSVIASDEVTWDRYAMATLSVTFAVSAVPADKQLQLRLTSYGDASYGTPNYVSLDWIEMAYPRTLAARGATDAQHFTAPGGSYTFELSGHTGPVTAYNPSDGQRHEASAQGSGTFRFSATPSDFATYWVTGDGGYLSPVDVRTDQPSNWANTSNQADYVILTTRALRSSAQALSSYRQSQNSYATSVVNVQNIFDQFDYGRPTPVAIRRFVRAMQNWQSTTNCSNGPCFLTIWADAQYPVYTEIGSDARNPSWSVPSFGFAPSDGWFAMQTDGSDDWTESLAIGRVPVRTNAQGDLFLEKLQTYESAPLEDWQKRMLMLAGGTSSSEQQTLQFYTKRWADVAARDSLVEGTPPDTTVLSAGMDTLFYFKRVNDPLDDSFQDSLAVDLQRGAGWLNYFGHSAAQTWEIVTDPPAEFNNAGRLPVVVSLACKTGSFAGGRSSTKSAPSLAEQLVVGSLRNDGTPANGTLNGGIAHWGTSALGQIYESARLNDGLINRVFRDTVRTLGLATQSAKAEMASQYSNNTSFIRHLLQYSLLGDPATQIAIPAQPDLHLAPELITTSSSRPTPGETLTVTVRLRNRGLIPTDSVTLVLEREYPEGQRSTYTRRVPRFELEQRVEFSFFLDERALGRNTFRARVDPSNRYIEANETNNAATKTQVVFDTGLEIVTPPRQGVVTTPQPTLRLNLVSRAPDDASILIELDSLPSFDSPFKQQAALNASGIAIDWTVPIPLDEGQTYFWRARLSDESGQANWKTGNFTIRSNSTYGWLQQGRLFTENTQTRLKRSATDWNFAMYDRTVKAISQRRGNVRNLGNYGFNVNTTDNYEYLGFGFGVLVMDGRSGEVITSGSFPPYNLPERYREFTDGLYGDAAVDALRDLLQNTAETGDYIFVRTRHLANPDGPTISNEVKNLFRTLGTSNPNHSQAIDTLTYDHMWTMKARKGYPSVTVEQVSPPEEEAEGILEMQQTTTLSFPYPSGQTMTDRIGPTSAWGTLNWSATLPNDSSRVRIDVLSADRSSVLQSMNAATGSYSLADLDASTHPYVRLRATLADSSQRDTPQLNEWSLTYDATAELSSNPAALQAVPDTLTEGAEASISLPVKNLGDATSGPVFVQYDLTDASNQTTTVTVDTLGTLAPDEEATSSASISTADRGGANRITITIQQNGPPEPITFNNTLVRNFFVQADETPPIVRVLVEGRELPSDPEPVTNLQDPSLPFVSTQPTIEILASDNSEYFPLQDTSLVEVRFDDRPIPFASSDLTFEPATSDRNEARIVFTPDLSGSDTTHTLQVEAEDVKGNALGDPYQVHFRVQQNQVIRDLYPYPNPMNTHTTFAFRVEGGTRQPEDFRLRIYTLSGRLVREFRGFEVNDGGGLRVGWNTLRWNGRDADGDRVATGVYLYRVVVQGENGTFQGDVEKVAVIR